MMSNPLFGRFGNQQPNSNNPVGNMANMLRQFNDFRSNFKGDPEQQVRNLLNSGQMSQEQFNQLSELAKQFQKMFGS